MTKETAHIDLLFQKVLQNGDYKAFETIFHDFYSPLCHFAVKIIEQPEEAEEIVGDVFFKIWKNRQSIQLTGSLSSYLFTAVKNQCIDYLRVKKPHFKEITNHLALAQEENPEKILIYDELVGRIEDAIENLPEQCKTIFRLSRDQGLKYQEIATLLGISNKTVETQMGRALKYLRSVFSEVIISMLFLINCL